MHGLRPGVLETFNTSKEAQGEPLSAGITLLGHAEQGSGQVPVGAFNVTDGLALGAYLVEAEFAENN